jgi:hypothetical protein
MMWRISSAQRQTKEETKMKIRSIGNMCFALAVIVMVVSACSLLGGSSPTATFKKFFEATKKGDPAAIRKTLSKGSLEMFDKVAKEQNKTTDEMMKEVNKDGKSETTPETRNEKIDGDSATLEVKNEKTGKWDSLPFIKENGEWKIAFDKFVENVLKDLQTK